MALWVGLYYFGGIMTSREEIESRITLYQQCIQLFKEETSRKIKLIEDKIENLKEELKNVR